jgi:LacI family transcriptional regulator
MKTLKDIAKVCEVSESTVSLAINKPYKISEKVREKIFIVIQKEGYCKLGSRFQSLGILVSDYKDIANTFNSEILEGILSECKNSNIQIRFFTDPETDYENIVNVQAFIFIGKHPKKHYTQILKYKIPIISCGYPPEKEIPITSFYLDHRKVSGMLTNYVVNCGHTKIAVLLDSDPNDFINQEFLKSIIEYNNNFDEKLVFIAENSNYNSVEIIGLKIISETPKITAVICSNDLLAYNFYKLSKKYRVKIPQDISITGFGSISMPKFLNPPEPILTTTTGNMKLIGKEAISLLKTKYPNVLGHQKYNIVPSNLVIGSSVARK